MASLMNITTNPLEGYMTRELELLALASERLKALRGHWPTDLAKVTTPLWLALNEGSETADAIDDYLDTQRVLMSSQEHGGPLEGGILGMPKPSLNVTSLDIPAAGAGYGAHPKVSINKEQP